MPFQKKNQNNFEKSLTHERCQETSKGLKNKLYKIKYMNYNFSRDMQRDVIHVRIKIKEIAQIN